MEPLERHADGKAPAAALGMATKVEEAVRAGARVLSVDLGVQTFAACSVFALQDQPSPTGAARLQLAVSCGGRTLWAVHERSFHLLLPDEEPGKEGQTWRHQQSAELQHVRRHLRCYRQIMR